MKRFAVLLALAALLAGCARIQPGGAELPTLTVMVLGGSSQDALARISDAVSEITRKKSDAPYSLNRADEANMKRR